MNTRTLKAKLSRSSEGRQSEWLFGMSGKATFLTALILVLLFCFIDTAVPGGKLIPTYAKHIVVNCLIYAILSLGLDFVAGYIGQVSLGHAAFLDWRLCDRLPLRFLRSKFLDNDSHRYDYFRNFVGSSGVRFPEGEGPVPGGHYLWLLRDPAVCGH